MVATLGTVRKIALSLEGVEEGSSYGTTAFRVKGKLFLRMHQDDESLIVRMGFDQREDLIAMDPDTYYITDHYKNYEWILVRLARVKVDTLRELIRIAWQSRVPKKRR